MRITAFEVAPGKASVLSKLINKIGGNNLKIICTNGNFSYEEERSMNADIKHVVSKSETCLVESYNSVLSYYLARLHCKTKCYSKSILMLTLSVKLLLAYDYGLSCSHEMVSNPNFKE
ncbi:MAG: IS1 family transposase [Alphaproteobacteria bacterium]|nr:IS1 family transposase [Alphaproteobacteria bacterium]